MAYYYTTFGSVTLPVYNRAADISPAPALPRVIQALGGAYDLDGGAQAALRWPHPLSIEAVVWEATAAAMRTAIDGIRALVGTRAYLSRQADSDGSHQQALCRLVGIEMRRSHEHRRAVQPVVLNFLQLAPWEAVAATSYAENGVATARTISLTNAGNVTCRNAVLTFQAASAITAVAVAGSGIAWTLTGAVDTNGYYVVACAEESVQLNAAPAYDRFALGSGHLRETWLPLEPGANSVTLTPTGGAINFLIVFRSTWQ